jgi:hypothetical protein
MERAGYKKREKKHRNEFNPHHIKKRKYIMCRGTYPPDTDGFSFDEYLVSLIKTLLEIKDDKPDLKITKQHHFLETILCIARFQHNTDVTLKEYSRSIIKQHLNCNLDNLGNEIPCIMSKRVRNNASVALKHIQSQFKPHIEKIIHPSEVSVLLQYILHEQYDIGQKLLIIKKYCKDAYDGWPWPAHVMCNSEFSEKINSKTSSTLS